MKLWTNGKYKNTFKGSYQYTKNDRVFTLTEMISGLSKKPKVISYESWQKAKSDKWFTIK